MLDQMSWLAVRRKQKGFLLVWIKQPAQPQGADDAPHHFTRQRNIESSISAALRPRDVKQSTPQIQIDDPRPLHRVWAAAAQQEEQMKFPPKGVIEPI